VTNVAVDRPGLLVRGLRLEYLAVPVGLWWADPVAALVIPVFLVREARDAWAREDCD